jgi:predicted methyltransferase
MGMTLEAAYHTLSKERLIFGNAAQIAAVMFIVAVEEVVAVTDKCPKCHGHGSKVHECVECGHQHDAECVSCGGTGRAIQDVNPDILTEAKRVIKKGYGVRVKTRKEH